MNQQLDSLSVEQLQDIEVALMTLRKDSDHALYHLISALYLDVVDWREKKRIGALAIEIAGRAMKTLPDPDKKPN